VRFTLGDSGYYDLYGMPISMSRWTELFGHERHVGNDYLKLNGHVFHVSTVWLGLDHSWGSGPPLIFETMIFQQDARDDDMYQVRYSTIERAREGHWWAIRWLYRQQGIKPKLLIHKGRKP